MTQTTTVRERPILFSGPMVRAILDGRKTMTRRVVADSNSVGNFKASQLRLADAWVDGSKLKAYLRPEVAARLGHEPDDIIERLYSPLSFDVDDAGEPVVQRLWVRETMRLTEDGWRFAADNGPVGEFSQDDERMPLAVDWLCSLRAKQTHCVSIHMPRWASRLSLEITDVRVERLQDISEDDAKAEGVEPNPPSFGWDGWEYRTAFAALWNELNAKRGYDWGASPWVWVIEFRRVQS